MRTWHLLLLVTIGVSLLLILREAPLAAPVASQYATGGLHRSVAASAPHPWESGETQLGPISNTGGGLDNSDASGSSRARSDGASTSGAANSGASGSVAVGSSSSSSSSNGGGGKSINFGASVTGPTPILPGNGNYSSNAASAVTTVASTGVVPWRGPSDPFIVLGVVSNCMWGNSFDRRRWIRETWKTYGNVGKTVHVVFIVALLQSNLTPISSEMEKQLREEAETHGDMLLLPKVPERKSPCLKTMAWFRHAVRTYPRATFLAKTDDDAFVQTIKLEANMKPFVNHKRVYIGSTLWGSYITETFAPCARRMGPNMCAGGMKEERCKERGAIGPYPYAVGMLQVLSYNVAAWMVVQEEFATFERRATAATRPPMMDQGEDMVIGMFLYLSPWPLMPLHWGWDKLHDLCFKCTRKDQIWRPITTQTVVAHHTANEEIITQVFRNITHGSHFDPMPCDEACQRRILPFEVTSLEDLCSRGGGSIARVYDKCRMVGK